MVVGAVVVAAGGSSRMEARDKLFVEVAGRPLLAHVLGALQDVSAVERIALVLSAANLERGREVVERVALEKVAAICEGGPRRQDSVRLGLEALGACEYVLVHDGARLLADASVIERGLEAVRETGAAVPAVLIADTVKRARPDGTIEATLDRSGLRAAQTPQVFRYELLVRAHREISDDATDCASMVEALGVPVKLFEGSPLNVKVTRPEDLRLAEAIMRSASPKAASPLIVHITRREEWERARSVGLYRGDTLDSEGFIHCSTESQVVTVANSAFGGQRDLILLRIDPDRVQAEIRFEGSSDNELFPHIYGPLNLDAIVNVLEFEPGKDGTFQVPREQL